MENSADATDADVVTVTQATSTASPVAAKSDENDSKSVAAEKTDGTCAVDDVAATKAAAAAADDDDDDKNSAPVKISDLNEAMASASISTSRPDDAERSRVEDVSNEHQERVTVTEEENVTADDVNSVDPDVSVKTPLEIEEEANSTLGGFEDAREYVDDEEDCIERDQNDVTHQDHVSAAESCGDEELLDDEEAAGEEGPGETVAPVPAVPVPVDDDTNDPQYIPRRGRFYEHDDRMAYSTTSSEGSESEAYEDDSGDDDGECSDLRRIRRRRTSSKRGKSTITGNMSENNIGAVEDGTVSSKKVLAISKVAAGTKDSSETFGTSPGGSAKKPGAGFRKIHDIDSLDKWTHDLYDEREQSRKTRDELLASYGYDIREESEAPRARRHHKYGRAATAKYTRNWQDTKAYTGAGSAQQSSKVKRGGLGRHSVGGPNKNKNKSATSDEYSSEFPALENAKPSDSTTSEVSDVAEASGQQVKLPTGQHQEKKTVPASSATGPSRHHTPPSRSFTKHGTSPGNRNHHQDSQNGGQMSSSSSHNKNFFNRSSTDSSIGKEKVTQVNRENTSGALNFYNRKPHQHTTGHNTHNNYKHQNFNSVRGGQGHNQHASPVPHRGRNFHQHNNNQPQFNRDRYFAKGSLPSSSNSNHHYDHPHHNNTSHATAGTGRTQHSGGNYHHFSNRQYDNENELTDQEPPAPPPPVVRSSKRYSVQSRRELPDPVLNFGGMSKTLQPQQQTPVTQHQQPNGMILQDQQHTPLQSIQMHQQQPPPMQIQQYHQPLQQIHPHHGMVLDHNTGMMVMATADPSMYHHQLYATPQYAPPVPPVSSGPTDENVAATALQMLSQATVYQPVPANATGLTSPPSGTQSLQQQQSETFMTTYYQPQQQTQQQPPPRRVNLAIPIVAPPPEPNQQGPPKTNSSPTPPLATAAASTN